MDYNERWNKICKHFENNKDKSEEYIQNLWEKLFSEIFGYSSLDNEIESERKMQLGSKEKLIPDIIIKNGNSDLFIVELKREDLTISDARKGQLYSYLKQVRCDLGILVCDKICLVDYDYGTPDENQICADIDFFEDNPVGVKFTELFSKENFDKSRIKEFIHDNVIDENNIVKIKNELTSDLIKRLVSEHFSKIYNKNEISAVLNKYNFIRTEIKKEMPIVQNPAQIHHTNAQIKQTSDDAKLLRDLRTVGFATFVKYYKYYSNPQYSSGDVKMIMRQNKEPWSENSFTTKASTGKGIISRGLGKTALGIIANANNADYAIIQEAKRLLQESE